MEEKTLKAYREEYGITQEQLSRTVGVNVRSISMYETNGVATAKFETIKKIAEALGADLNNIR